MPSPLPDSVVLSGTGPARNFEPESVFWAGFWGALEGIWHGTLMVVNEATFELIGSLDSYVDELKVEHDGMYVAADFFAFVAVNAAYAALVPNLRVWARNPLMYELGSIALPRRVYVLLDHLTPI